jgi:hypothetical protein
MRSLGALAGVFGLLLIASALAFNEQSTKTESLLECGGASPCQSWVSKALSAIIFSVLP